MILEGGYLVLWCLGNGLFGEVIFDGICWYGNCVMS